MHKARIVDRMCPVAAVGFAVSVKLTVKSRGKMEEGLWMGSSQRRVQRVVAHVAPSGTAATPQHVLQIELGDTASAWVGAGFSVMRDSDDTGTVLLPNLLIRLTATGAGLSRMVLTLPGSGDHQFVLNDSAALERVSGDIQSVHHRGQVLRHPNSAGMLGEVTLFVQDLGKLVTALEEAGFVGKQRVVGSVTIARYMVGEGAHRIRLLICGPVDASASGVQDGGMPSWMEGDGSKRDVELTGWLFLKSKIIRN